MLSLQTNYVAFIIKSYINMYKLMAKLTTRPSQYSDVNILRKSSFHVSKQR